MKIGQASSDENKKLKNGKAGDQTKKEVYIREWYSRPWNYILRAKDEKLRNKIAEAMTEVCNNDCIGYDQNQRNTLLTQYEKVGKISNIKTNCETDCSATVSVCLYAAGIDKSVICKSGNCLTTSNMRSALKATGKFEVLTEKKYLTSGDYLKKGDILLYEGHHVAVAIEDGSKSATQTTTKKKNPWPTPTRTLYKGCSKGDDVKWLQFELKEMGYVITIDGSFGSITDSTLRVAQKRLGLTIDGKCGPKTRAALIAN